MSRKNNSISLHHQHFCKFFNGIDFSTSSEELYKLQIWTIKLNKKIRTDVAEIFQGALNFFG